MNVSPENLTADEAAFVASYVERERKISAHFVSEYERRMDRRQGVCISGCDPTPYTMPTDERLTANAMGEVLKRRVMKAREPFQVVLNTIGHRMASRDKGCADLARSLTFASQEQNRHLVELAPRLDAVAERHPDLIRDVADAKHCIDAMAMIAPYEIA
jgi:hypothetical protein